jgi:hypothetical protein
MTHLFSEASQFSDEEQDKETESAPRLEWEEVELARLLRTLRSRYQRILNGNSQT